MSREPSIMIDFENRRVFCATCGEWIPGDHLLITGRHTDADDEHPSQHRVWERA